MVFSLEKHNFSAKFSLSEVIEQREMEQKDQKEQKTAKIAVEQSLHPNNSEKIASLTKEAESLKAKLDEERQKLNDLSCKLFKKIFQLHLWCFLTFSLKILVIFLSLLCK